MFCSCVTLISNDLNSSNRLLSVILEMLYIDCDNVVLMHVKGAFVDMTHIYLHFYFNNTLSNPLC